MESLYTHNITDWPKSLKDHSDEITLTNPVEEGKVLYFPKLAFQLNSDEKEFLSDSVLNGSSKNISYNIQANTLKGFSDKLQEPQKLKALLHRYATQATDLVNQLLPEYKENLLIGRTSYRPAKVEGRQTSPRKDDTRLHVDAFPSTPTQGKRILRVFSNVNPDNLPRVWNIGDVFANVVDYIKPSLTKPVMFSSTLMHLFKITRAKRTKYDHFMLQIHDKMKLDEAYQVNVKKTKIDFPAHSTWMVFTDQVSHAALAGQFLFEQTFYLPADAMVNIEKSPLKVLERKLSQSLV